MGSSEDNNGAQRTTVAVSSFGLAQIVGNFQIQASVAIVCGALIAADWPSLIEVRLSDNERSGSNETIHRLKTIAEAPATATAPFGRRKEGVANTCRTRAHYAQQLPRISL